MSALEEVATEYLALRSSVGYRPSGAETIFSLVAFLERRDERRLTTASALAWAGGASSENGAARRLAAVRGFAKYLQAVDPASEVPPAGLLPLRTRRRVPYLFSEAEVLDVMAAASDLRPATFAATCASVVGLLWVTGMRIGEVCRLARADVDLAAGRLTIWRSKFGKSRELPLQPSTVAALADYDAARRPDASWFFARRDGGPLAPGNFGPVFAHLLGEAGVPRRPFYRRPVPGDLRHSFAVRTLLEWSEAGWDVQALLPRLSTYLGHGDPAATYWYLSASPELMGSALARLEAAGARP